MNRGFGKSRLNRRDLIIRGATTTVAAGMATPLRLLLAQDASPEAAMPDAAGLPPLPDGATVIGQALWNPADIVLGPDGTIYIAEGGVSSDSSDDETMATPAPDGSPIAAPPPLVPPQISLIAPDGTQAVLTTEAGGVGIGYFEETLYVSVGGGSVGAGFTPLARENTISSVAVPSGDVELLAELGPYEVEHNPDGSDINPNLYGLGIGVDGTIYVADAGGNTIYKVDSSSGEFSVFAVVPNSTELTGGTPTADDASEDSEPRQSVPTSVAIAPDGTLTVTLLSMMWDGPSILDYQLDGSYTVRQTDPLSMIVDSTYGPDGLLYVTQLSADMTGEMPAPGAVFRIEPDGSAIPVVENLFFPHGIGFHPTTGNLFVTTNSIISGPDAPLGMLLRFDGVAVPAA